jgi:hypothetical protein
MSASRLFLPLLFFSATVVAIAAESVRTEANVPVEIRFVAEAGVAQPDQVELDAVFAAPDGSEARVPAFWAGGNVWKVRYASGSLGSHRYRTEVRGDFAGLAEQTGEVEVGPYTGDNPLYRHGALRVTANRRFVEHQDGTPFFWLGDTWWMGLSQGLSWPHGFQTLAADRKTKGFTLIQLVGGLPPPTPLLNERVAGDGGQAWTENFESLRPGFYDAADLRIQHLVEIGLVPCIIGAWGDYLPVMGPAKMKRHWRNLVARYGAYPVVWYMWGEINGTIAAADSPKTKPSNDPDDSALGTAWTDIARYLKAIDPFRRMVGVHHGADSPPLNNPTLPDVYLLRTGHSGLFSISAQTAAFDHLSKVDPHAPVVLSEGNHQGLFAAGNFSDQMQRHQFWVTMLDGGAGHTYGASGISQANKPGTAARGDSQSNQTWPEAMYHAASSQLGWARSFLEEIPWKRLVPVSHKVKFVDQPLPMIKKTGARWIAPPEASDKAILVVGTLMLPQDAEIRRATLRVSCEAPYELSVNDQIIHRVSDRLGVPQHMVHQPHWSLPLLGEYLRPGQNILRFRFEPGVLRPSAGLVAHVGIELTDGRTVEGTTNRTWRWGELASTSPSDMLETDVQRGLRRVRVLEDESYPDNGVFRNFGTYGPRCAEMPGEQWMIYVPAAQPIEVSGLPAGRTLSLTIFNPVTAERTEPVEVQVDGAGVWRWRPPSEGGDRVLRLSVRQGR